jgi:type II secretory ATPase GspE/PulE/Tfp pilus assembly ATPase PilB-like protein
MNDAVMDHPSDLDRRLAFFQQLQAVSTQIHATGDIDEIMLDLGPQFCDLLGSERFTLYAVTPEKTHIVSKVKTGPASFRDLRLSISASSIAGFCALSRKTINLADVYDDAALRALAPELHFERGVDERTGHRTRAMLVAPVVAAGTGELLGVVQCINHLGVGPFPASCADGVAQLCATLAVALGQRMKPTTPVRSKYDALVADALLSASELALAMRTARDHDSHVEDVLVHEFKVKPAAIGQALARFFMVPYEPYKVERTKPVDLLRHLKSQDLALNQWLPLEQTREGLFVLAVDPERVSASRIVNQVFPKAKLFFRVTTVAEFRQTAEQFFGRGVNDDSSVATPLAHADAPDAARQAAPEAHDALNNHLAKLLNKVIVDAHRQGVSDIHIEPLPGKGKIAIRLRKDGALVPYIELPASYRGALVARVKGMCDLDVAEQHKPQHGKLQFKAYGPLDIELSVATIPTSGGVEDVVMRIVAVGEPVPLEQLGVLPHNLDRLRAAIEKPYGLFFVSGPAGSGKSTTLHSMMHHLNKPDTKIWTVEDPVDITQKGLRQVQVNRQAGLDVATVMRAVLRADPDVIMVGEMRDKETVGIGIDAALTGHLVLATLQTNSATESLVRLLDMGMDPFNLADALLGVLAQRLAKRLCDSCKQAYHPSDAELALLLTEYCGELLGTEAFLRDEAASRRVVKTHWQVHHAGADRKFTLYRAVGCRECDKGYRGRVGLHELLIGTDKLKRLLQERASVHQLLAAALDDGMLTLKMDGIEKVLAGITDIKMVRQVCIK